MGRRDGLDDRTGRCLTRKAELRRRLRRARTDRTEHERANVAAALVQHAAALAGSTIAAFVGVRSEPPTVPLLEALARARRAACCCRCCSPTWISTGRRSPAPPTWRRAGCGCWSPSARRSAPSAIATADLVLVPALAVDGTGMRLGQGGGSYDRALARTSAPVVAVVFGDEVLESLPAEDHDRSVDGVLTPDRGLRWLRESPGGGTR